VQQSNESRVLTTPEFDQVLASADFTTRHKRAYDKFLAQLAASSFTRGANLKRLSGELLRFKISRTARVLAVRRTIGRQTVWILTDLLLNHEYGKRVDCFNFGRVDEVVAQYHLAKAGSGGGGGGGGGGAVSAAAAMPSVSSGGEKLLEPVDVSFYNQHIIARTAEQRDCLQSLRSGLKGEAFTALVSGSPGAGKSSLAAALIDALAGKQKIIYVAESSHLREEMRRNWEQSALLEAGEVDGDVITFTDYESLLRQVGVLGEGCTLVDEYDLQGYFDVAVDKALGEQVSFHQFQQECSVMTDSLEAYLALGQNHSLFSGKIALQEKLWALFVGYQEQCRENARIHLGLHYFEQAIAEEAGDVVYVVDEAMDLTRFQLKTLIHLFSKLILMGDFNQALNDSANSMEYVGPLVASKASHNIICLVGTHRCPGNVVSVANQLLRLTKMGLRHSALVDRQVKSYLDSLGVVGSHQGLKSGTESWYQSTGTAVICHPSRIAEVRGKLGTPLVFSIKQIKGLSYKRVIVYDMLAPSVAGANKKVAKLMQLAKGERLTRETVTPDIIELTKEIHGLYTAVMRAEEVLVFMQSTKVAPVVNEFIDWLSQRLVAPQRKIEQRVATSTQDDWKKEADRLRELGQASQAAAIQKEKGLPEEPQAAAEAAAKRKPDLKVTFTTRVQVRVKKKVRRKIKTQMVSKESMTVLDFSKPLTLKNLAILLDLQQNQVDLIQPRHVLALLKAQACSGLDSSCVALLEKLESPLSRVVMEGMDVPQISMGSVMCKVIANPSSRRIFNEKYKTLSVAFIRESELLQAIVFPVIDNSLSDSDLLFIGAVGSPVIFEKLSASAATSFSLCARLKLASQSGLSLHEIKEKIDMVEARFSAGSKQKLERFIQKQQKRMVVDLLAKPKELFVKELGFYLKLGLDVNYFDENNSPLLYRCVSKGHIGLVKVLLNANAAVNQPNARGDRSDTPLCAAAYMGYLGVIRVLLAAKAVVGQANGAGYSPLCTAAQRGQIEAAKVLLEGNAAIDRGDNDGYSPLTHAVNQGCLAMTKFLLEAKAAINIASRDDGGTVLHRAVQIARESGSADLVVALLAGKAAVNQASHNGVSPLYTAAVQNTVDVVKILLAAKADVGQKAVNGSTPLRVAVTQGYSDVVSLLRQHKSVGEADGAAANQPGGGAK
jgi:ankyrin repeat protein